MKSKIGLALALGLFGLSITLSGCDDPEERKDVGYTDGYAVGYNTACEIRATLVDGDFENSDYAAAYASGEADGIMACNADKASGGI